MDVPQHAIELITDIIGMLVTGDYQKISDQGKNGRLSPHEIAIAISTYGRKLVVPPSDYFAFADIYELIDGSGWSIDVPLWTVEEGQSDLTLSLSLKNKAGAILIGLDDIHVL